MDASKVDGVSQTMGTATCPGDVVVAYLLAIVICWRFFWHRLATLQPSEACRSS
jgi:hypothetical protein